MKKSIDESYIDLTEEAAYRIRNGNVQRLVLQSPAEAERLAGLASARFAVATAAWQRADALMLSKGIAPQDLESRGSLRGAKSFSASTDPITELRKRAREEQGRMPKQQPVATHPPIKPKHLEGMTEEEIEAYCNTIHPIDYCRGDKRLPPCMLVPSASTVTPQLTLPGVADHPWRETFVGYVFLDGTDPKETKPTTETETDTNTNMNTNTDQNDQPTNPNPTTVTSSSLSDGVAAEDLATYPDDIAPPHSFSHEDPLDPSHDYLMAVGSQIAFEIRKTLFETLGFTTSSGIAPNCMLAKLASSLNKPNQQSVVRWSIAPRFLRDIKLKSISGFGPVARDEAAELGLVTVGDVQRQSPQVLFKKYSDKFATYLLEIAQAIDETPVIEHSAPKSIGQSKQQRTANMEERIILLQWLCEKLMDRILDDQHEFSRRPTSFTFSWVTSSTGWCYTSRRCSLPPYKEFRKDSIPVYQEMLDTSIRMCKIHIPQNAQVRCLAIGVSQFVPIQTGKGIAGYFNNGITTTNDANNDTATDTSMTPATTQQTSTATATRSPPVASSSPIDSFFLPSTGIVDLSGDPPNLESAHPDSTVRIVDRPEDAHAEKDRFADGAHPDHFFDEPNDDSDEIEAMFGQTGGHRRGDESIPAAPVTSIADTRTHHPHTDSTDSSSLTAASSIDLTVCPRCSQSIPSHAFAEHADFHFASELQQQLRHEDRIRREHEQQQAAATQQNTSATSSHKRRKATTTHAAAAATPASSAMSIDRFMVAATHAPAPAHRPNPTQTPNTTNSKRTNAAAPTTTTPRKNTLNNFFKTK